MKITITIDDDVAGLLRRRAAELGISFEEVAIRTIRAGLSDAPAALPAPAPKTRPHSFEFRPGIDPDKLGQLADELEAEAFVRGP